MFTTILDILQDKGRGIHAYAAVARTAMKMAALHPEQAAGFYVLATTAETFVDLHERMPVSSQELAQAFAAFTDDVTALQEAYEGGDPATILAALNRIAAARAKGEA
ncbi:hypothetical protein [Falsirhodobacter algicola]|uniref:Uncharacterized protein n=1 Tax=Falsirhodobacter algicola TaxID=2692330 RepID=A0A8J8SKQ1_9RHOB|nr:hypothetical protein [Falsirhodobacter algicola]QUS36205.1 hypothetical protein GR316_07940 [Falsirhodobacter algicola]